MTPSQESRLSEAMEFAKQWKGRADDAGRLARAVLLSESKRFRCEVCKDTGQVPAGNSGLESDGNAPVFDPCPECPHDKPSQSPYSLGYNELAERVVQLERELAVLRSASGERKE